MLCKILLLLSIQKVFLIEYRTEYDLLNHGGDLSVSSISMKMPRYSIDISDNDNIDAPSGFKVTGAKNPLFPGIERNSNTIVVYPEEATSCTSRNYTENLRQLRKNVSCRLRERVVELDAAKGAIVYPNIIVLKQCEGLCNAGRQCLPNGAREVSFYVRKFHNQNSVCSVIKVLEPTDCSCGCPDKNTCPRTHKMNSACKCVCRNRKEARSCAERENTDWDERTCKCSCREQGLCTTGTFWSENTCRCMKPQ